MKSWSPFSKMKTVRYILAKVLPNTRNNCSSVKCFNKPKSSNELPRAAGVASMFRLPVQEQFTEGLDACFVGIPMDHGTSNRPGTRFGPRQIRTESTYLSSYNIATGASPFKSLQVADIGDVCINQYNLSATVKAIQESFRGFLSNGCKTIAVGGDHTLTYPILRAFKEKYGPVALLHIDAHDDTMECLGGERVNHGTPFKRAGEDGCLDFQRVVQIGLRGTGESPDDWQYGRKSGFRIVPAWDCYHKSLTPLMKEVRAQMGDAPVYISFDIDALDPAYAPGTGTPEVGGLTSIQALEILRGCRGMNIVGCDLVEVSPMYDPSGNTSLLAANLLFEMLCVLPGVKYIKMN